MFFAKIIELNRLTISRIIAILTFVAGNLDYGNKRA